MKTLMKLLMMTAMLSSGLKPAVAQITKAEKKAAQFAALNKKIAEDQYTFDADWVNPLGGGGHHLDYYYDLRVTRDTVIAFLPYFGRAYVAPIDPTEGGIKFTTTKFSYDKTKNKKGGWSVVIKPKENNIADMKDVRYMRLDISNTGYASLQVISSNRDQISFTGTIKE